MTLTSSCVLPPEGKDTVVEGAFPPTVDLRELVPSIPLIGQPPSGCPDLVVLQANQIVDPDSARLLFRWVANNKRGNTFFIKDEVNDGIPNFPTRTQEKIEHERIFQFDPSDDQLVGVVSLFVTDADAWAVTPNPDEQYEDRDLSGIEQDSEKTRTVVEVRWTFHFKPGLPCDFE